MFLKSFSRQLKLLSIILLVFAVTSCQAAQETDDQTGLPNPASVFCEEQGGKNETRTDASGGQYDRVEERGCGYRASGGGDEGGDREAQGAGAEYRVSGWSLLFSRLLP